LYVLQVSEVGVTIDKKTWVELIHLVDTGTQRRVMVHVDEGI
jgi:hypothetical protein